MPQRMGAVANAGRVELNIVAVGEDQLSAMLAKLDGTARKTTETVQKAGAAAETLGQQHDRAAASVNRAANAANQSNRGFASIADQAKTSVGPLNKFREAFNLIGENINFVRGGLVTAAIAVGAFIVDLLDTEEQLDATTKAMFDTAIESAKLTTELGKSAAAASTAARNTSDFAARIATLGAQAARLRGDLALAQTFEREARAAQSQGTIRAAEAQLESADKAANAAQASLAQATKRQGELRSEAAILAETIAQTERASGLENERARARLAAVSLTLANVTTQVELSKTAFRDASVAAAQYSEEIVALEGVEAAEAESARRPTTPTGPRPTGGGPRRQTRGTPGAGSEIIMTSDIIRELETVEFEVVRLTVDINKKLGEAITASIKGGWENLRDEITASNDAMLKFLSTIEQAANAALPELGAGLQELATITEDYSKRIADIDKQVSEGRLSSADAQAKASDETAQAIIGGSTAVLAGLAKELGGLREFYLVKAAGEVAAGVATSFTNPAESVSHFSAAVLYGVAAARAGGGGGGGSGASASRGGGGSNPSTGRVSDRDQGGGGATINISTLVTDRAQVRRVVGAVMARRDRSGYSRFEGS